ncbi:MAG: cation transporting ATPase C-terminal domain-containing protein [Acidimicrobiales bacterium]
MPLTAAQLLWINVIADGPPALALGLDRNPGVMRRAPRPTTAPLLTQPALRFILGTGILKAALGLGLFFTLPGLDYSGTETRTAVFLYESLAQVAFVYPARALGGRSAPNRVLDAVVAATVVLQVLTVTTPGLRSLLDLAPLDSRAWALVAMSLAVSLAGAWASARATREIQARQW